ncbi:MAG TPA: hypothetical protein VMU19_08915 [Bryobacteraceae bacterium]|nr:hypothetical protein [Bryobacteraceae bacterium]
MQRFQFRLERVLEWRRKKCRMEENRLSSCLAQVRETEAKIERLRAERAAIECEFLAKTAIGAPELLSLDRYRSRAKQDERLMVEERGRRELAVSEQRNRVRQAQQRVKLLEKMRERRLEEYTAEAARELEAVAAESYLARWPRKSQENAPRN